MNQKFGISIPGQVVLENKFYHGLMQLGACSGDEKRLTLALLSQGMAYLKKQRKPYAPK